MATTGTTSSAATIYDATSADFAQTVIERSKTTPVLVDFWAAWCGPCRALTPQIEQAVAALDGQVVLAKVDVDAEQQLAQQYQIAGIPHVKLFKGGREVDHFVGMRAAAAIEGFVAPHVGPSTFERLSAEHREAGRFTDAVQAFDLGYSEQAFEHLLREVEATEGEERMLAREFLVAAFEHVGADNPSVQRHRKRLASILY